MSRHLAYSLGNDELPERGDAYAVYTYRAPSRDARYSRCRSRRALIPQPQVGELGVGLVIWSENVCRKVAPQYFPRFLAALLR
jgi:hypothetical protein